MESTLLFKTACAAFATLAISTIGVYAQEAVEASESSEAEVKPAEGAVATAAATAGKPFVYLPLMCCQEVQGGVAEVKAADAAEWTTAVTGRYYPFGSEVRFKGTAAAKPLVRFGIGTDASICIEGEGSFATRPAAIGEKKRVVLLMSGTVGLDLPRTLKDGVLEVAAPDFVCQNLAGQSRFVCAEGPDGRETTVRVVTGSLSVSGLHYKIERMGAADQVRIITSPDKLMTSLRGESGDGKVTLDCGVKSVLDPETGKSSNEPQTLAYQLSPKCAVKIWRKVSEKAAGGSGKMAVVVQTFDAQGKDKNLRSFFEDRPEINSGELIAAPVAAKKEKAEGKAAGEEGAEEKSEEEEKPAAEASGDAEKPAAENAQAAGDGL